MLEPHAPEIRQELAAARVAALHRSTGRFAPGPFRRVAGSALVRLGLRLGYDGSVPPSLAPESYQEALASAGASTSVWRMPFRGESVGYGLRSGPHTVARLRT